MNFFNGQAVGARIKSNWTIDFLCLLTYLHPTSKERWKGQVDTPKKLSSQETFGEKYLIAQVSYLFLLQYATHFASKDGAAGLKMMDCPKWAATEILQLQWVTLSRR